MKHSLGPDLTDKAALVTGAGRGIGRSIAQSLADHVAQVVLAARTIDQLKSTADQITADGGKATPIATDVADESSVRQLFAATAKIGPLDILINCAGIGRFGALRDFSTEDFDTVLAINLRGTFLCCREAMRIMAAGPEAAKDFGNRLFNSGPCVVFHDPDSKNRIEVLIRKWY